MWEAQIGEPQCRLVRAEDETLSQKQAIITTKNFGGVTHVVQHLPTKCMTLSSNPPILPK
jgi:hypothetical protein